jgi:beta-lactamase class A
MEGQTPWAGVEEAVRAVSRRGTVGLAIVGPAGATWGHHDDRRFVAASTVKIPIMVEVFRQIDAGRLRLDDRCTVTADDRTPGSGVLAHMGENLDVGLSDLLYLMMSISDNVATNLLLGRVGIESVNRTMAGLGMDRSNLGRPMRGRLAEPGETENLATPGDYARLIVAILDGLAASAASCQTMLDLMGKQQNRRRTARYLPVSSQIRWGSKTGENVGVTNDVAFVVGPNGRLIVAAFTENFPDMHTAEQAIGEVARAAMADTGVVGPLYTS